MIILTLCVKCLHLGTKTAPKSRQLKKKLDKGREYFIVSCVFLLSDMAKQ